MKTILFIAIVLHFNSPSFAQETGGGNAGLPQLPGIDRPQVGRLSPSTAYPSVDQDEVRARIDRYFRLHGNDFTGVRDPSDSPVSDDFTSTQKLRLKQKLQELQGACPACSTGVVIGGGTPQVVASPPPSGQPMALPAGVMVSISYSDYTRMLRKERVFDRLKAMGCALDRVEPTQKVIPCVN